MAAGTGQQCIDTAEAGTNPVGEAAPGRTAGRIADQLQAARLPGDPFQRLAAATDQHQVVTFASQAPRAGLADARASTGDDDGLRFTHQGTRCGSARCNRTQPGSWIARRNRTEYPDE